MRSAGTIKEAKSDIIFATPERLADPDFLELLRKNQIDLFVIDEAHCISQWGHDFRPAFLEIGPAIRALGRPPVLALTATATDAVIEDIAKQLELRNLRVINTGIYRPNLHYRVVHVTNRDEKARELVKLITENPGSGIVYTATVKAADEVHELLSGAGVSALRYHGRLSAKERKRNQEDFMDGHTRMMVATNAFGMGIDKTDIRFIVHYQFPASLEAYYQESGRAGRDGNAAQCTLLYDTQDKRIQQFFLVHRYPTADDISAVYESLARSATQDNAMSSAALRKSLRAVAASKQQVALKLLKDARIVGGDKTRGYRVLRSDLNHKDTEELALEYREKADHDHEKLERMIFYAQTAFCRWKVLHEYFDESFEEGACGACDNCLTPRTVTIEAEPEPAYELAEISDAAFATGQCVRVAKYGEGRIVSTAGEKVTVVFADSATRTFLRSYVEAH